MDPSSSPECVAVNLVCACPSCRSRPSLPAALTTPSIGGSPRKIGDIPCRGVRGHKARRLARITPRDLCRVVSLPTPAGCGLWPHNPISTSRLSPSPSRCDPCWRRPRPRWTLRPFSFPAQFLHAGANGREIVGSTRSAYVSSHPFGRFLAALYGPQAGAGGS
jgi:hypothetical protein